jgi:hypothetical protein
MESHRHYKQLYNLAARLGVHLAALLPPLRELFSTERYQTGEKNGFSAGAIGKHAHWSDSAAGELEKLAPPQLPQLRPENSHPCPRGPTIGTRAARRRASEGGEGRRRGRAPARKREVAMEETTPATRRQLLAVAGHRGASSLVASAMSSSRLPPSGGPFVGGACSGGAHSRGRGANRRHERDRGARAAGRAAGEPAGGEWGCEGEDGDKG